MLTWAAIAVAVLLALASWLKARGLARKLDQVTHYYWDLRYEHGQLKARVARLEPGTQPAEDLAQGPPAQAFIPLSSLKR